MPIPSSTRRGGCRIKKMLRSHLSAVDGVVGNAERSGIPNHPVRSDCGGFALFFLMSRPPLLAKEGIPPTFHLSVILMVSIQYAPFHRTACN